MEKIRNMVELMKTDTVKNYVIAGLNSSLLSNCTLRYFECDRRHQDTVTPHSHRFDFFCIVLEGWVVNRLWTECQEPDGDLFQVSAMKYEGEFGKYTRKELRQDYFTYSDFKYVAGEFYSMDAEQIHSIFFSKNAKILFFESKHQIKSSNIIEPVVDGEVIKTCNKLDYMFKKA